MDSLLQDNLYEKKRKKIILEMVILKIQLVKKKTIIIAMIKIIIMMIMIKTMTTVSRVSTGIYQKKIKIQRQSLNI